MSGTESDGPVAAGGPSGLDPTREATRQLAAGLRALVNEVVDKELSLETVTELSQGIDDLRRRAVGPRRPRYYEIDALGERSSAFIDFSPISGYSHPLALPMGIERTVGADGAPAVMTRLELGLAQEGPPHGVHGGVIAALFDELLGHALHARSVQAVTASLTVHYRALTPINEVLNFFAELSHLEGRRWRGRATCHFGETLTAEAEALFVGVDLQFIADGSKNEAAKGV